MDTNNSILISPTIISEGEITTRIQKTAPEYLQPEDLKEKEGQFNRVFDKQFDNNASNTKNVKQSLSLILAPSDLTEKLEEIPGENDLLPVAGQENLVAFTTQIDVTEDKEAILLQPSSVLTGIVNMNKFKPKTVDSMANISQMEVNQNKLNATSSLLAGSLASPSKENLKENTQLPPLTEVDSTLVTIDNNQRSGKLDPLGGKNLPRNLPFFVNEIENKAEISKISDLVNKVTMTNQQIINSLESQNSNQLPTATEESSVSNHNPSTVSSIRAFPAFNLGGQTQLDIKLQAGGNEWNTELGNKIRWMGDLNLSKAELKLHPAELGTIEIKIITEDNQTKVNFITTNNAAKEVIENSLPKLRELLESTGLQLEQSDVSHKNSSSNNGDKQQNYNTDSTVNDEMEISAKHSSLVISETDQSPYDHYV